MLNSRVRDGGIFDTGNIIIMNTEASSNMSQN
jgi:hypothetical protein